MNLVERLRKIAGHELDHPAAEAADEIERLRTLLEEYLCASSEFDIDGWLRRVRAVTEDGR